MTVEYIHEGGGCEAKVQEISNDLEVHISLCENKATHIAIGDTGEEKRCCAEHGAAWLEGGLLVDLIPL